MKWFKFTFSLGNVIAASKFSLIYLCLLIIGLTTMSFTDSNNNANTKSPFSGLYVPAAADHRAGIAQLNPQAMSFVQEYMRKQGAELEKMKEWGKPYFDLYDKILASYGVHYDNDPDSPPFASSALNSVRLWYKGPQGILPGPTLFGDMIWVEKPYRSEDGHWEFAVRSRVWPQSATRIQLLLPPEGQMAFRVLKDEIGISVDYIMQPDLPFQ